MSFQRPITPEEAAIIRQMLSDGASIEVTAAKLGRGAATVSRYSIASGLRKPGAIRSDWTPERMTQLKALFDAGLSCSKIAEAMGGGLSRNAVIGKCTRMGWKRELPSQAHRVKHGMAIRNRAAGVRPFKARPKRKPRQNNLAAVNLARRAASVPLEVPTFAVVTDATNAKPWLERAFGECAYPISGEGADTFSCCAPSGDRTYCPAHSAVMFVPPKEAPSAFRRLFRRAA